MFSTGTTYPYDVTRDGKRLLVTETVGSAARPIELITNWQSRIPR